MQGNFVLSNIELRYRCIYIVSNAFFPPSSSIPVFGYDGTERTVSTYLISQSGRGHNPRWDSDVNAINTNDKRVLIVFPARVSCIEHGNRIDLIFHLSISCTWYHISNSILYISNSISCISNSIIRSISITNRLYVY